MYQTFDKLLKACLCLLFLSLLPVTLHSQDKKVIDSLKKELDSGINRHGVLIDLAIQYVSADKEQCLYYLRESEKEAYELGDTVKIVTSGKLLGEVLRRYERNDEAEKKLLQTLAIARRNNLKGDIKFILNSLGVLYTMKADYDRALECNFESLLIREADSNKREISISLNNIGLVYFKLKNYQKAIEFFNRALKLKKENSDQYDLDRLLINMGLCYNQLKSFIEAQKCFNEAFELCKEDCKDAIKMEGQFGLGVSNFNQGKYDEALANFTASYEMAKQMSYRRFQAENLLFMSKIYIRQGDNQSAIDALHQSEEIAGSSGYNELLIDIYREFSGFYNHVSDFQNAVHYQNKYISLKDSIYSEDLIQNLTKVQTQFEERENIKTIASKEEIIRRQRSLNIAIAIIAILASMLLFVLYQSNQVKKRVNKALSEAKAIIEDQNRQLLSSNYSLNKELQEKNADLEKANESLRRVNEELDNFIYKTSHDIRGPLASLKGMCNVALMDVHDPVALNYLRKLDITAEKLNTILTRLLIVNQINNSALGKDRIDFASIINDVLILERKKGLPPNLKIKTRIDHSIEFYSDREFIRIILENLIDNAIKFYNDSGRVDPFVDIEVAQEGDSVKIKVIDNGIGISKVHPEKIFQMFSRASERSETGGIGLYITKTAVEKLGGSVNLRTTPENYTEFYVLLPLQPSNVTI